MPRSNITLFLLLVLCFLVNAIKADAEQDENVCRDHNFKFSEKFGYELLRRYKLAVIQIQGDKKGSGVIVDAKNGYVLTANHVAGKASEVVASSPRLYSESVTLSVVERNTSNNIDLALLRAKSPDILKDFPSIDVSSDVPDLPSQAYVIGYARGEPINEPRPVTVTKIQNDKGIIVSSNGIYPGDSGGALISSRGLLLGIGRWDIDDYTTHFTPMYYALPMLKTIGLTSKSEWLDTSLRSEKFSLAKFADELVPEEMVSGETNLELVNWANLAASHINDYPKSFQGMIYCPVVRAFGGREISDAAEPLFNALPSWLLRRTDLRFQFDVHLAENLAKLDQVENASNLFRDIVEGTENEISLHLQEKPVSMLNAINNIEGTVMLNIKASFLGQIFIGSTVEEWFKVARTAYIPPNNELNKFDVKLSSLLESFARASFGLSKLSYGFERPALRNSAQRALSVSIGAIPQGYRRERAQKLKFLGEILYEGGFDKTAAAALAASYQLNSDPWVEQAWELAAGRVKSLDERNSITENGIKNAPVIDNLQLAEMAFHRDRTTDGITLTASAGLSLFIILAYTLRKVLTRDRLPPRYVFDERIPLKRVFELFHSGHGARPTARPTWEDAVAQIVRVRTEAETSVALLKKCGDVSNVARGQLIYSDIKAEADAVIAGLIVALSEKGQPEKLSSLQERVDRAVTGLAKLRDLAERQVPKLEGTKEFNDILKRATEQLQKPLSDAVAALYNNFRTDNELTRKTIQTQLGAARWQNFAEVNRA